MKVAPRSRNDEDEDDDDDDEIESKPKTKVDGSGGAGSNDDHVPASQPLACTQIPLPRARGGTLLSSSRLSCEQLICIIDDE